MSCFSGVLFEIGRRGDRLLRRLFTSHRGKPGLCRLGKNCPPQFWFDFVFTDFVGRQKIVVGVGWLVFSHRPLNASQGASVWAAKLSCCCWCERMQSNYLELDLSTKCGLFASALCFLINKTTSNSETLNQNENYFDRWSFKGDIQTVEWRGWSRVNVGKRFSSFLGTIFISESVMLQSDSSSIIYQQRFNVLKQFYAIFYIIYGTI